MSDPGRILDARLLQVRTLPRQQSEAADATRDRALRRERCPPELRPRDEAITHLLGMLSVGFELLPLKKKHKTDDVGSPGLPGVSRYRRMFAGSCPFHRCDSLGGTPTMAETDDGRGEKSGFTPKSDPVPQELLEERPSRRPS
ncbi:hypothetical protein NDU88_002047 [Pleurodeles waltl]|uniref:Uncharacterized protein n=1 Tax=Pleurodeles waltl TaxID=8319 RepID=A0AAV7VDF3_PLEWA|nr:hypothetical protein NDU88_002047 [Pleurodeles waltl]